MNISRLVFVSIAVLLVYQTGHAHGLISHLTSAFSPAIKPVVQSVSPLVDKLPLNLVPLIHDLLCITLDDYPNLENDIDEYNSYTSNTKPKCCRPDQFPDLFRFLGTFFTAIYNLGLNAQSALCQLLALVVPLTCSRILTNNPNSLLGIGCVLQSLLGPLFGKLGELSGKLIVGLVGPLDVIDGCLITGIAQFCGTTAYGTPNTAMGSSVGITNVPATILGIVFATMYCLGHPFSDYVLGSYDNVWKSVVNLCDKQISNSTILF